MIKNIRDRISFSSAIEAMCRGLRKQDNNEAFEVDMQTFGDTVEFWTDEVRKTSSGQQICFGCAATATVMELSGKQLSVSNINYYRNRAAALGFEAYDLLSFEKGIDEFREGLHGRLLDYFVITEVSDDLNVELAKIKQHPLHNDNWRKELIYYDGFASSLKKLGY